MTEERIAAIVRLLDTRDDNLPVFAGARASHSPGFSHRVRVRLSCEDCLANGRIMFGCTTCGGRGHVEEWRSRDPYASSGPTAYGIDRDDDHRHVGHVPARDAEIARLDQQLRDPWKSEAEELDDANRHPYAWETARETMYEKYDYAKLDAAMEELRARDLEAHSVLVDLYVRGRLWDAAMEEDRDSKRQPWHIRPSQSMLAAAERGLAFIGEQMPDRIRAPRAAVTEHPQPVVVVTPDEARRSERDARIRELARVESLRPDEIAIKVRVSIRTVYRVLTEAA